MPKYIYTILLLMCFTTCNQNTNYDIRVSLHITYNDGSQETKNIEMTVGYKPLPNPFYLRAGCIDYMKPNGDYSSLICGVRNFFLKDIKIRDRHERGKTEG